MVDHKHQKYTLMSLHTVRIFTTMLDVAISNWEGVGNEAKHKYVTPLCYVYTQVSIYIGFYL